MKVKIDNQELDTDEELSIFKAAQKVGVDIPVMCYLDGHEHFTSCMMCVVKDKTSGRTFPACSALIADGMEIETQCEEIREARKLTLELLLSDHIGDCEAPCQRVCPISMEVPKMIREIMNDQMEDAVVTVRKDIAVPSFVERHCNAPCEKGCRRSKHDEGLAIRELTRHATDWDLRRDEPYVPPVKPSTGKKIAVIGGGVTGLTAAHFMATSGHACTVYEKRGRIGGRVETELSKTQLPDWVHDGELKILRLLGIDFEMETEIGVNTTLEALRNQFDAVVFAAGNTETATLEAIGLPVTAKGLKINSKTLMTDLKGVFAGGSVIKAGQPLIKSATTGKLLASIVHQYLNDEPMEGIVEMYNHAMGRLMDGELEIFVSGASPIPRLHPENLDVQGFSTDDAKTEASRCMHCDCREKDNCKLRIYSDEYDARQQFFKGEERATFEHVNHNAGAVYEPGKCIKCGLCVRVSKKEGEPLGFTFVGRGFNLKTGISLNETLDRGLEKVAEQVVEACPTGALAQNEKYQPVAADTP